MMVSSFLSMALMAFSIILSRAASDASKALPGSSCGAESIEPASLEALLPPLAERPVALPLLWPPREEKQQQSR